MKRKLLATAVAAAFAVGLHSGQAQAIILDKNLQFDAAIALTVTAQSAFTLDMLNARDMAIGEEFAMLCRTTILTAMAAAGAATLTISVEGSVDNIAWVVYAQTAAIAVALLTAGRTIDIPLPPQAPAAAGIPRYYRLTYTVATGPMTAGTLQSDLIVGGAQQSNPPTYPPGVTVSN